MSRLNMYLPSVVKVYPSKTDSYQHKFLDSANCRQGNCRYALFSHVRFSDSYESSEVVGEAVVDMEVTKDDVLTFDDTNFYRLKDIEVTIGFDNTPLFTYCTFKPTTTNV